MPGWERDEEAAEGAAGAEQFDAEPWPGREWKLSTPGTDITKPFV